MWGLDQEETVSVLRNFVHISRKRKANHEILEFDQEEVESDVSIFDRETKTEKDDLGLSKEIGCSIEVSGGTVHYCASSSFPQFES